MLQSNIIKLHAEEDTDVFTAKTACELATTKLVCVIAEDTDILVLLCHHMKENTLRLFILISEIINLKHPTWDIKLMCNKLGSWLCNFLHFLHAICGCDTTSRLFWIGKGAVFKKNTVQRRA